MNTEKQETVRQKINIINLLSRNTNNDINPIIITVSTNIDKRQVTVPKEKTEKTKMNF